MAVDIQPERFYNWDSLHDVKDGRSSHVVYGTSYDLDWKNGHRIPKHKGPINACLECWEKRLAEYKEGSV